MSVSLTSGNGCTTFVSNELTAHENERRSQLSRLFSQVLYCESGIFLEEIESDNIVRSTLSKN